MHENGNLGSAELRLAGKKKINQSERKANKEMVDVLQSRTQELSLVTRESESKSIDYKEKVQERTQEVGHGPWPPLPPEP